MHSDKETNALSSTTVASWKSINTPEMEKWEHEVVLRSTEVAEVVHGAKHFLACLTTSFDANGSSLKLLD